MNGSTVVLIVVLLICVALFLIVRAFWLWYWKVNVVVHLLTEIRDGQARLAQQLSVQNGQADAPSLDQRFIPKQDALLRAEPGGAARVTGSVPAGTPITVIKRGPGAWAWVQADDGTEGWLTV